MMQIFYLQPSSGRTDELINLFCYSILCNTHEFLIDKKNNCWQKRSYSRSKKERLGILFPNTTILKSEHFETYSQRRKH